MWGPNGAAVKTEDPGKAAEGPLERPFPSSQIQQLRTVEKRALMLDEKRLYRKLQSVREKREALGTALTL
jgi:hypothetical protein